MKMWQKILLTIIVLIVISLLVFLYSKYIGAKMFYVKEYPLYSTTIDDSYNGLKIAHLSDIHYGLGLTKNDLEKIVKDVNSLKPDIIVFTGDLVNNKVNGSINKGYVLLVGFTHGDTTDIVDKMINKILNLRIFEDENDKMNLSIKDINGSILSISQFTLYADSKKGNRPSFINAMKPDEASKLYDYFNQELSKYIEVNTGIFGSDMKVEIYNDGPVTIILDSDELFKK